MLTTRISSSLSAALIRGRLRLTEWARANNLQLNRDKTKEIIFVDKRRKRSVSEPPVLPGITRVTSLTVLGVTPVSYTHLTLPTNREV